MRDYSSLAHELDSLAISKNDDLLCALLVIYIPRLDDISLEYGYRAGEKMIRNLTDEIVKLLKEQGSLARIGRQEFSILLKGLTNAGQAILAAQKICDISNNNLMLEDNILKAKFNIGIAYFPHHGSTSFELIQKAGIAARAAADKRILYCVYSEKDIPIVNSYALENLFRTAIDNADITANYQPIIDLQSGEVVCLESLARWNSDEYGFVSPDTFVAMAEKSSLIRDFSILTLNTTMRQHYELKALFPNAKISINLSAILLSHDDTIDIIKRALNIWDMPPESLILEVTESAIMEDKVKSSVILTKLSELGIKIAIDDFGTGQASFKYLRHLPISDIKIDKSFIVNIDTNNDDIKIVNGIIDLAHGLNLSVVAEGIEDERCATLLRGMGCEYGQGYVFAPPMPIEALPDWIQSAKQPTDI